MFLIDSLLFKLISHNDFIDDVTFNTGGFSAIYGDKLSSIMELDFRDGNPNEFDVVLEEVLPELRSRRFWHSDIQCVNYMWAVKECII